VALPETYYITTPIYYPSDKLHVGHTYTTVAADALARYHRLRGVPTWFLTGTDEHGQKIERAARAAGKEPQVFVDEIVGGILDLWRVLRISFDDFIRTTEPRHERVVQAIFRRLHDRGDIYRGSYEGPYCTQCEAFYTMSQLVGGNCPIHGTPAETVREQSYFFRLSRYGERLLAHIEAHPDFIQPPSRRNEVTSFVRQGLEDLSVSRTTFRWGIPVPFDPQHVIYVWIDALANYVTALGYPDGDGFRRFWPADLHLIGKDILRFHAVIWPCLLMALDIPLPRRVFGHGWLLVGGAKASKSAGNVVDPFELVRKYGVDAVRYFLLREIPFGADGEYSEAALVGRINADLANDLGNWLHRTVAMVGRFAGGCVPDPGPGGGDGVLRAVAAEVPGEVAAAMESLDLPGALAALWRLVARANKYLDESAPWSHPERVGPVLYSSCEALRVAAVLLAPFLPETPGRIWHQLGLEGAPAAWGDAAWGGLRPGIRVRPGEPLFPRIDVRASDAGPAGVPARIDAPSRVSIDDFRKAELRVARVLAAERVPKADRLLRLEVDLGTERRQIVAGVAQHYGPEELVGRQVVVVANLEPTTIRGVRSEGMLLAASHEGGLALVRPDAEVPPGSQVR
jgi:methionyl-tRNA synthetase